MWQEMARGSGGLISAALDSPPGPGRVRDWAVEDNFCQQPAGPACLPRAAVPGPTPALPLGNASAPTPTPTGLLTFRTCGSDRPEEPGSAGWVGGGALLPHASCAPGSAAPARAAAPSAASRLRGGGVGAPGALGRRRGVPGCLQA